MQNDRRPLHRFRHSYRDRCSILGLKTSYVDQSIYPGFLIIKSSFGGSGFGTGIGSGFGLSIGSFVIDCVSKPKFRLADMCSQLVFAKPFGIKIGVLRFYADGIHVKSISSVPEAPGIDYKTGTVSFLTAPERPGRSGPSAA
jgi:hypothetical protein